MMKLVSIVAAVLSGTSLAGDFVADELAKPLVSWDGKVLPRQVYDIVYNRICAADRAAEDAWMGLKTAEEAEAYRKGVREAALRAMGGLPERTPLNAKVTGTVQKDGYSIVKILFESRPQYYVTANLFLPDPGKFKPPYAGVLVPCGHSLAGKGRNLYQHGGVVGAKAGLAMLVYDPTDQGERMQIPGSGLVCGHGHQHSGERAFLIGSSQAQFRLWDGMRALDVLAARPEVDAKRLGVMGLSGGGTMTAYISAFDDRVVCACPAGYITTVRDVCMECGPQDAEQVIFGQLGFGLNHLGILLLRATRPVCPVFSHDDFFTFRGSTETLRLAERFYAKFGAADAISHLEAPGPHDWYASSIVGSVAWMRRHLCGDTAPFDPKSFEPLNLGFTYDAADCGVANDPDDVRFVTKTGQVMDIPGARSIYDILRDEYRAIRKARAPIDPEAVRRVSTVRSPAELKVLAKELSRRTADGVTAVRRVFVREDGVQFASVSLIPEKASGAPVFIVAESHRTNQLAEVRGLLAAGRPVSIMELRGRGETGGTYRRFIPSFHSEKAPEEEIARMMDFLGDSLVARRAEDILLAAKAFADDVKGAKAELRATGPGAIPAAHAWYFGHGMFSDVKVAKRPLAWSEVLEDEMPDYHFSNCIFGALKVYDWAELLPPDAIAEKPFDVFAALPRPPKKLVRLAGGAPIRYLENSWGFKVTRGTVEGAPRGKGAFLLDVSPRGILVTTESEAGEKRARALLEELVRTGEADTAIPSCRITDWEGEGDELSLKLSVDESWWGLGGGWGRFMPFTAESGFAADIRKSNAGHPVASFLVSDKGRYIWCDEPVGLLVTNGMMRLESDRGKIEVKDGFGDLREAYLAAAKAHFPASGTSPDPLFFSAPQLNTWVELTYNQNQKDILAYVESMRKNGVPPGVLMIDDTWQYAYGTWEFDPRRFSDPKAMMERLHKDGYSVLLWTCPFVSMDSPGYRELADCDGLKGKGGFVMNGAGVPYPVKWWNGYSAMLDMTHPEGRAWFSRQLDRLQKDFGVDGFKLDGGGIPHYAEPDMVVYDKSAAPAWQSRAYGEFALKYPMSECRALFRLGGQPIVTRLGDKSHNWKELNRCVTDMLAVGICGYPFICPDMIGGGSWIAFIPELAPHPFDEELFVRSAQVHALCPMMQFSASPWRLLSAKGQDAVRKAVATRQRFADRFVKLAEKSGRTGEPMMRYMEYQYPGRGYAAVKDQFVMGDFLLVAPQLVKGAATRTVEIPEGTWTADDGTEIVGPRTVTVKTPLDRLPHFVRKGK